MEMTAKARRRAKELTEKLTLEEKLSLIVETADAVERLGIPKYYHGNEALHGIVRPGKFTVFPQAIAFGAMFDDAFLETIACAVSTEARAKYFYGEKEENGGKPYEGLYNGLLTFWSPDLNLARDPRWGRTAETYGEDPYLAGKCGAAFVRGIQGYDKNYLKAVATPKHFTANNEEHNRFSCNAVMSEKTFREYHLEPFRIAVKEGHPEAVMAAYNAINGVPCHENRRMLTEILREEWGFDGYVVSDCGGISSLWDSHHKEPDEVSAAAAALNAGIDLECGEHFFKKYLKEALLRGMVTQERIDEAVTRVLTARIKAGQFDSPEKLPWYSEPFSVIGCEAHGRLAYEAAVKSAVLLKNNGILPLNNNGITVAVCGNNANIAQFGDYSGVPVHPPVTPLEGISACEGVTVRYAPWQFTETGGDYKTVPAAYLSYNDEAGVQGSYYDNPFFSGNPKTRTDNVLDFKWNDQMPDPLIVSPSFSVIWHGEIEAPYTGTYRFGVRSSGSAKCTPPELFLNNGDFESGEAVRLERGEYIDFILRYVKNTENPACSLTWQITPDETADDIFAAETDAARGADAVIAVIGLGTEYEREGRDKTDLSLPREQIAMLKKLKEVNPNLIVVLENGSAVAIPWIAENASAILEVWYPGERGGTALADLIFGKVSPSGRLPLAFPKKTEDLPAFDDYEMENGRTYMYRKTEPLFDFGFGLSYTAFAYENICQTGEGVKIEIKNTGDMQADEVVQLYIDSAGMPGQPRLRLKGFKRINLKPGETKTVAFPLNDESFSLFGEDGVRRVYPGTYCVYIDGHLPDEHSLKLKISKTGN